jgi:hypothetical protein
VEFGKWERDSGAKFFDDADFGGCKFKGDASFSGSIFDGKADFEYAHFYDDVDFSTHYISRFNGDVDFSGSRFEGDVDFGHKDNGSGFSGDSDFTKAQFNGETRFSSTDFKGYANFSESTFEDSVYFQDAHFGKDVIFASKFGGKSHFDRSQYGAMVWFTGSKFRENSYFIESKFKNDAYFNRCLFVKDALFEGSEFFQYSNFAESEFNGLADFGLTTFNGLFALRGLKFDDLNINWDTIKGNVVTDGMGYLSLVKHFKDLQQLDAADDCFYRYRVWRMQDEFPSWNSLYDFILYISCGFGVRPWNTLILSLISIILFGFAYWLGDGIIISNKIEIDLNQHHGPMIREYPGRLLAHINDIKSLKWPASKSLRRVKNYIIAAPNRVLTLRPAISPMHALYFSSLVFFVALPPPAWHARGVWKYIVLAEDILGWFLTTLFVVTLGHVMIR